MRTRFRKKLNPDETPVLGCLFERMRDLPLPSLVAVALIFASAPAVPAFAQEDGSPVTGGRAVIVEAPLVTMRDLEEAGALPMDEVALAAPEPEGYPKETLAAILEGDLLPDVGLDEATLAGTGGDELGFSYGEKLLGQAPGVEDVIDAEPAGAPEGDEPDEEGGPSIEALAAPDPPGGGGSKEVAVPDPVSPVQEEPDAPGNSPGELADMGVPVGSPPDAEEPLYDGGGYELVSSPSTVAPEDRDYAAVGPLSTGRSSPDGFGARPYEDPATGAGAVQPEGLAPSPDSGYGSNESSQVSLGALVVGDVGGAPDPALRERDAGRPLPSDESHPDEEAEASEGTEPVVQDRVTSDDLPEIEAAAEWASGERTLPEDARPAGGTADPPLDETVPADGAQDQYGTAAGAVPGEPASPPIGDGDPEAGAWALDGRPEVAPPGGSLAEESMEDGQAGEEESQATQYGPNVGTTSQPPLEGEVAENGDDETSEIAPLGASAVPPNGSAPQDGLPTRVPDRNLAEEDEAGPPEPERTEHVRPENGVALAERGERRVGAPGVGRGGGESPNARPGKPSDTPRGARTPADKGAAAGEEEPGVVQTADGSRTVVRRTIPSGTRGGSQEPRVAEPPREVAARAAQRAQELRALARQTADRDGAEESLANGRRATPSTARHQVAQGSHRLVVEGNSATASSFIQATVSDTGGAEATVKSVQASSRKRGGR